MKTTLDLGFVPVTYKKKKSMNFDFTRRVPSYLREDLSEEPQEYLASLDVMEERAVESSTTNTTYSYIPTFNRAPIVRRTTSGYTVNHDGNELVWFEDEE